MPYFDDRTMSMILLIRTRLLSSVSRAERAMNPQSWTANTIARKMGRYWLSNGQLMKTLLS